MLGEIGIGKARLTQNAWWGCFCYLFSRKTLDGAGLKKAS